MRYITLNATKPTTTDKDVKRTHIVRLLNPSLFYFVLCLIYFYVILLGLNSRPEDAGG
jgi:hypothetical protein